MSDVVHLFWQQAGGAPPKPRSEMAIAVDSVLTGSLQLSLAAARLVERFDAIDALIDALDDGELREVLRKLMTSQRQQLSTSILVLKANIKGLSQS
ncbi:MAG: hypothetical protein JOY90_28455 [Bradyrhizobium sp.]|uniref:hypothetical protein n=1 Tax=Bradyrhizobium sp. TaxID=376 RepID=UPI001DBE2122|nr:hypothetical protein [Bradyrhizobium sp.]MBV9564341.1 hypothetical protein [Bradyrhizobium sp.]